MKWEAWFGEVITRMESDGDLLHIQIEDGRGITVRVSNIEYWKNSAPGRTASEYGNDEIRWPDGLQHY